MAMNVEVTQRPSYWDETAQDVSIIVQSVWNSMKAGSDAKALVLMRWNNAGCFHHSTECLKLKKAVPYSASVRWYDFKTRALRRRSVHCNDWTESGNGRKCCFKQTETARERTERLIAQHSSPCAFPTWATKNRRLPLPLVLVLCHLEVVERHEYHSERHGRVSIVVAWRRVESVTTIHFSREVRKLKTCENLLQIPHTNRRVRNWKHVFCWILTLWNMTKSPKWEFCVRI